MQELMLKIISPEGELFCGQVERVALPGQGAPFVVLRGHAPLISSLTAGEITFTVAATHERQSQRVEGGFVEVLDNQVLVCTE